MTTPRRRQAFRRKEQRTGSPNPSEPVFVLVGMMRRPHGLRGEMLVSIETDFPERIQKGTTLLAGEDHTPLMIASRRTHADGLLLAFEGYPDKESVSAFRNQPLSVPVAELPPLPAGQYYQHQLLGIQVLDEQGLSLGVLAQILDTSANDVYLIRDDNGGELLLPAIRDVIRNVDLENKRMTVHLLPGLREIAKTNPA